MKNYRIKITIVFLLLIFLYLSGCSEERAFNSDEKLLGSWKNSIFDTDIIMFFPDGTWASTGSDGTWTIQNNKLIITIQQPEGKIEYIYDYSLSIDNRLTLTRDNGITKIYIRQ